MNRKSAADAAVAVAVAVVAAVSLFRVVPPVAADTVSADVLPDGEVEIRVSAGNVTAKRTSFTSPDTGYVPTLYTNYRNHIKFNTRLMSKKLPSVSHSNIITLFSRIPEGERHRLCYFRSFIVYLNVDYFDR